MNKRKLYSDDLASKYKEGEPYRPSNGTEGMMFESLWCDQCPRNDFNPETGEGGCMIQFYAMCLGEDDPGYPKEWNHGPDGQPRCTAFGGTGATQAEMEEAGQIRLPE